MTYVKRLTINGFKSFAKKTDINFDNGINVIVGPNGSGKSNISDALCFVLGRLSIKSMRAAKASNLLFMGSKMAKPANEASVEIVFDNEKKTFALPHSEIALKRIVKRNGQSVYKINDEVKTRAEVIEALAQAGIDPHGFNIVLQGGIQAIVKMHPEERRKVIEEVAGISIYESRKEKSIKELEKTEERLKEISAILRERTSYLKNLEREKAQATRYQDLDLTIKRCKASILTRKKQDKEKELDSVRKSIESKTSDKEKLKQKSARLQEELDNLSSEIEKINKHIQKSTGLEQETLHENIANLKAEIEGLRVRKENYEYRKEELERKISEMESSVPGYESEIQDLRKESPLVAKKQEELKKKKQELSLLEEEKKKIYSLKTELQSYRDRIKDKNNQISRNEAESDSLLKQIESLSSSLDYKDEKSCLSTITKLQASLKSQKTRLSEILDLEINNTKLISVLEAEIQRAEKIKSQVLEIDVCPLCQNKMTEEHVSHVTSDSDSKINESKAKLSELSEELRNLKEEKQSLNQEVSRNESILNKSERELSSHKSIADKTQYMKRLLEEISLLKRELADLESKRESLERKTSDSSRIEENYKTKMIEIEEISSRTEKDLDQTLMFKERDLEKIREVIKITKGDSQELEEQISDLTETFELKLAALEKKEAEDAELSQRFKKMFEDRDKMQSQVQEKNYDLSTLHSEIRQIEDQINFLKVGNARLEAERDSFDMELTEYSGIEVLKLPIPQLEEKLQKSQQAKQEIGSINMRALEVYEEVKKEYDRVQEKVQVLDSEKSEILKIIEEIDNKKKKTFMKTFNAINDLFTENFLRLYTKGKAYLEIENKEDMFSGGVNIVIRLAKGKYFDVTSLSGGEQTMVAISLLFAIQEHKPYHFYIFDEIDAALDKRNSERLSALVKKYIKAGQYIIITHNDALITDSNLLYGVSMQEGISKILSLRVNEAIQESIQSEVNESEVQNPLDDLSLSPEDEIKNSLEDALGKV